MKNLAILRYGMCLFVFSLLITSCSKEEAEEIIETPIETEYKMEVTLRGSTTTYDAFAAYCNTNGIESFSVSNNADLLGNDLWSSDIEEGDFVVHYRSDANGEFSLGGTIFDTNGIKVLTITDDSSVDITVDAANSTEVLGSMSGDFLVITDPVAGTVEFVPFSVSFAGEVDGSLVPILCQ